MFRALLKKQLMELNSFYFFNKKTGKIRSGGSAAGMIILFAFVFLSVGAAFMGISALLCDGLAGKGNDWLYFALMGMMSIALGTFGSVFNTYAGLYHAKDNELLLSMPIPTSYILIVRMLSVFLMSLLYTALVWVPTVITYLLFVKTTVMCIIFMILLLIVITVFVTVLTCALGWVVALISSKLKNKSFITVLITVTLLGGYYFVYFRINSILTSLIENSDKALKIIRTWLYPVYMLGRGATGEIIPMLAFTVFSLVLFGLLILVLSRSFVKITTASASAKKKKYSSTEIKTSGLKKALLMRELRHFTASPTYMLNCGLGAVVGPVLGVFALIKSDLLAGAVSAIAEEAPMVANAFALLGVIAICLVFGMNVISAPSVSLEGRSIWIMRSMPVDTKEILRTKARFHIIFNTIFSSITALLIGLAIRVDALTLIMMIVFTTVFNTFTAEFGLIMNLKKPNLDWTSETVPIKQGISVVTVLFADWGITVAACAPYIALSFIIAPWVYLLGISVIFAGITLLLRKWTNSKGVVIFENL